MRAPRPQRRRRRRRLALAALFLATGLAQALNAAPVILNPSKEQQADKDFLRSALIGSERFWGDGDEVLIALLKNDPQSERILQELSGMTPSKFKNHWQRLAFSGRGKMPKSFDDRRQLIDFVERNPGAIAIAAIPSKSRSNATPPASELLAQSH